MSGQPGFQTQPEASGCCGLKEPPSPLQGERVGVRGKGHDERFNPRLTLYQSWEGGCPDSPGFKCSKAPAASAGGVFTEICLRIKPGIEPV